MVRLTRKLADHSHGMSAFMRLAAQAAHVLLYGLLIAIPVVGWALTSAHDIPLFFLGVIHLPKLVAADSELADTLSDYHVWLAWGLLAAAAVLLLLPSLLIGTMISHSSPQNLTWATQFADQFRAGILYPRAVPDSYEGLGGAWNEFISWIEVNGHKTASDLYECYVVGPESSLDSANWRTELCRPVIE